MLKYCTGIMENVVSCFSDIVPHLASTPKFIKTCIFNIEGDGFNILLMQGGEQHKHGRGSNLWRKKSFRHHVLKRPSRLRAEFKIIVSQHQSRLNTTGQQLWRRSSRRRGDNKVKKQYFRQSSACNYVEVNYGTTKWSWMMLR